MEAVVKTLGNKYIGKSDKELNEIFKDRIEKYSKLMMVLNPTLVGVDFLARPDVPLWIKIAHMDEYINCPYCQEEYQEKLKERKTK